MLIPKADRQKIHVYLFNEGVVVAKKDYNQEKHEEIDTKNLYVIKALQSLTSKGFVKTQFSWQYYYYSLTDEGIEYLREWLHLPSEVVPATHRKPVRAAPVSSGRPPRR
ncbi:Plectin/S10 [Lipomyces japonicus]|uniref:40S ribosomal protein eS10 n=1 Tax=Lipomyces japonicus TaxID=56871 RepID=UPI0034CE0FBE